MRSLKFVILGLLFCARVRARAVKRARRWRVKPDSEIGIAEPDLHFLKRMRTFRGPYSDQDDPILRAMQAKEADRTGVTAADLSCRPLIAHERRLY